MLTIFGRSLRLSIAQRALLTLLLSLFTTLAIAVDVDCSLSTVRCIDPMVGTADYVWGGYIVNVHFSSFEAAVADVEARLNHAYAPCTLTYWTSNQFASLSSTSMANGITNGGDSNNGWVVYTSMGRWYGIRWWQAGGATLSNGPGCSGTLSFPPNIQVGRQLSCPQGFAQGATTCYMTNTATSRQPDKSRKPGCNECRPSIKDPVDVADGFMWQIESPRVP